MAVARRLPASALAFGSGNIGASTSVRYLGPWYDETIAENSEIGYRIPKDGVIRNLQVRQNQPAGNGSTITYTIMVNGSGASVSVTMASTAFDGADSTNSIVVNTGDLVSIRVTKSAPVGSSPRNITATVEYA